MKAPTLIHRKLAAGLACGAIAMTLASEAPAAQKDTAGSGSRRPVIGESRSAAENVTQVRITRATNYLGSDVFASDGRKVGDIVDFVFDVSATPRLAYAIVMTGGFLDLGGDNRAVPAEALQSEGDTYSVGISSDRYWDLTILPEDRRRFLLDARHARTLRNAFDLPAPRSGAGGQPQLVFFGQLRNAEIYGAEGERLGFCVDAWVSLERDRAPYIEITPTFRPFRTDYDLRYAIPLNKFEESRGEFAGYEFAVRSEELTRADPITETEGVEMLQSDFVGDTVLRVRLAERGAAATE